MKTICLQINALLIIFLLSACDATHRGGNCYSFSSKKLKKTHLVKRGNTKKKKRKKHKNRSIKNIETKSVTIEDILYQEYESASLPTEKSPPLASVSYSGRGSLNELVTPLPKDKSPIKKSVRRKKHKIAPSQQESTIKVFSPHAKSKKRSKKTKKKEKIKINADGLFAFYMGLIGLGMISMLLLTQRKLKKFSYWAKNNRKTVIGLITAIKVFLIFSGLIFGKFLFEEGYVLSDNMRKIIFATYLLAILLYPVKKSVNQIFKHSYLRQKLNDLALVLIGFLLMLSLGNKSATDTSFSPNINFVFETIEKGYESVYAPSIDINPKILNNNPTQKKSGSNAPLIILSVIVFLGLMFLLAIGSCALSCNGQEALAVLVSIVGTAGLITALVFVIKAINKN